MDDNKRTTLESYAKHAQYHASKFSERMDFDRRYEFKLFMHLLRGTRVLELGCGAGEHTKYFASQGLTVTGIDLSPEMLALAQAKGLDARLMDIEHLDFPASSFDGVWAVTSLLHIPKQRLPAVVDHISTLLAPEGLLYVCVKEGLGEGMVTDVNDKTTSRFFAYYEEPELRKMFAPKFQSVDSRIEYLGKQPFVQTFFRKK